MLRLLIEHFWPVLIPVVFYSLWFLWARHQVEEGQDPLKWTDGPWGKILLSMLIIGLLCFIPVIRKNVAPTGEEYQPASFKGGKLVPGKIK